MIEATARHQKASRSDFVRPDGSEVAAHVVPVFSHQISGDLYLTATFARGLMSYALVSRIAVPGRDLCLEHSPRATFVIRRNRRLGRWLACKPVEWAVLSSGV